MSISPRNHHSPLKTTVALVLGAKGQLGRQIVSEFRSAGCRDVVAYDIEDVDIADQDALRRAVLDVSPGCVLNCAALSNVDACELNPQQTEAVNARPVSLLADVCQGINAQLVQISTDFVFDGRSTTPYREDDPANPLNVYGRSKLAAEQHARGCARHLIVRTSWLFGPGRENFVARILGRALTGEPLSVVSDQIGRPTYCIDLAVAIRRLIDVGATGVYHVSNAGTASWHELAAEAVRLAGLDVTIKAIATSEYASPAQRPAYSVLDTKRYQQATGHQLRDWRLALQDYMEGRSWMPDDDQRVTDCQGDSDISVC